MAKKTKGGRYTPKQERYDVVHYGSAPILERPVTETVRDFGDKLQERVAAMAKVMDRDDGIGLAAPQVGIPAEMFLVNVGRGLKVMCNPVITEVSSTLVTHTEGCLSMPKLFLDLLRPDACSVTYTDARGRHFEEDLDGLEARVVQHELDHLQGVMMLKHASTAQQIKAIEAYEAIKRRKYRGPSIRIRENGTYEVGGG